MNDSSSPSSHTALRAEVADLFEPSPLTYWLDFSLYAIVGWTGFAVAVSYAGWLTTLLMFVAAITLYRTVVFTHELVHVGRDCLRGFRIAWNAACGVPLLAPSFLYDGVHQEHHFANHYGTAGDGEYLPFGQLPRRAMAIYIAGYILVPLIAVLRFGLIAPISWVWPASRHFILERMSSLSIDPRYVRKLPSTIPMNWLVQEAACAVFVWCAGAALWMGWLPLRVLWMWYLLLVLILVLNGVRTLAAHRYANGNGAMTRDEQLLDSVNIAGGSPLTPLLAPVGLRYHALHHLFPTMPYHNLGAAHRRLMQLLPPDAPYRETVEEGFACTLADLWRRAGRSETRPAVSGVSNEEM